MDIETKRKLSFVCPKTFICSPSVEEDESIFLLPHTGFSVELQVHKLETALKKGLDRKKTISSWEKQTREDIWGFWLEYLKKEHLLPINMELKGGVLVARKYGEQACLEITSKEEREGSVKNSLKRMQDFLALAPAGSVAILTSPPGWSNLFDSEGKPIFYPDTQTYVFYLDPQRKLEALTVVSGFSLKDNETFLSRLTDFKPDINQTKKERIIKVTSSPILMSPPKGFYFDLEGIIKSLDQINPKAFNLARALSSLEKLNTKREIDSEVSDIVNQIGKYLKDNFDPENPRCFKYLRKLVGKVILDITNIHLEKTFPQFYSRDLHLNLRGSFRRALAFLQTRRGCNGGGKLNQSSIETIFGRRRILAEERGPSRFCGTCNKNVNTYIADGIIYCSICDEPLGKAEEKKKN